MKNAKHYETNSNKKVITITIIVICILISLGFLLYNLFNVDNKKMSEEEILINSILNEKTKANEKLVLKSKDQLGSEKVTVFYFENDILKNIKACEKYVNEDEYNENKIINNKRIDIKVIADDSINKRFLYEKTELGSDEELNYEQIYDKYLNQIIGAYEIVK